MHGAYMRLVVAAPLLMLMFAACGGGSARSAATKKAPSGPDDVYSYCFDEGKAAGDRVTPNGWGPSPDYSRFTNLLDSLSGSLLPASDIAVADWFQAEYQSLTGKPAWVSAESRAAFESASKNCSSRYKVDVAAQAKALDPSPETRRKTVCVAKAAYGAETRFGTESLAYTPAYLAYVHDHAEEDDPQTHLELEAEYKGATSQSPFVQPAAAAAFRVRTSSC